MRTTIRRLLARERAESISALAAEERRLADERRGAFEARERLAGDTLAERFAEAERRVDERLQAFTDDLDRAQRHLEAQLARLEQRHRQAIVDVEHRIEAEASEIGSTADEQRKTVLRLREELERAATEAVTEALDELESQTTERRRAIDEITDRLRTRETVIAEGIERAETDARGRLEIAFVEFERRQTERIERVLSRELDRQVQAAALAFDERMRELRGGRRRAPRARAGPGRRAARARRARPPRRGRSRREHAASLVKFLRHRQQPCGGFVVGSTNPRGNDGRDHRDIRRGHPRRRAGQGRGLAPAHPHRGRLSTSARREARSQRRRPPRLCRSRPVRAAARSRPPRSSCSSRVSTRPATIVRGRRLAQ